MISFEGRAPAWDNIPALSVTAVGDLTEGGKSLLVQTDAGPLQISLYSFGARLRLGVTPVWRLWHVSRRARRYGSECRICRRYDSNNWCRL